LAGLQVRINHAMELFIISTNAIAAVSVKH